MPRFLGFQRRVGKSGKGYLFPLEVFPIILAEKPDSRHTSMMRPIEGDLIEIPPWLTSESPTAVASLLLNGKFPKDPPSDGSDF